MSKDRVFLVKSISLRLRGISEDGTDLSDLIPTLEKKFNSMGISLKKNDNTFKSTYEIFSDISKVYDSLSSFQQSDLLELIAGKENANVAASLISNFADSEGALQAALNSVGSSATENQKYIDSLAGHVAKFQNQVTTMWSSSIQSDSLKQVVDLGTVLVGTFGKVVSSLGPVPTLTALASTGIVLFTKKGLEPMMTMLKGLPTRVQSAAASFTALARAEGVAAATSSVFATSLRAISTAILPIAVITGATFAITEFVNALSKSKDKMDETISSNSEHIASLTQERQEVEALSKEYDKLYASKAAGTATADDKSRLIDIQKQLIDQYNVSSDGIDRETKTLQTSSEQIKNRIALLDEQIAKENSVRESLLRATDAESTKTITTSQDDIDKKSAKIEKYNELLIKLSELENKGIKQTSNRVNRSTRFDDGKGFYDDISVSQTKEKLGKEISDLQDQINKSYDDLSNALSERSAVLNNSLNDYIKELQSKGVVVSQEQQNFVQSLIDSFSKDGKSIDSQISEVKNALDQLRSTNFQSLFDEFQTAKTSGNQDRMEQIRLEVVRLLDTMLQGKSGFDDFKNQILGWFDASEQAKSGTEDLTEVLKTANEGIENTKKSLSELASAYDTLHDGEKLSADSLMNLIEQYPQIAEYLSQTNDLTLQKGDLLKQVAEIERQARIQEAQDALDSVNDKKKELEDKQKLYAQYYSNISSSASLFPQWDKMFDNLATGFGTIGLSKEEKSQLDDLNKQANELAAKIKVLQQPLEIFSSSSKSSSKSQPELKDAIEEQDLTDALIKSFNAEYLAREKNVDAIDRKIKLAEKQGDEARESELITKKIEEETKALESLNEAQEKIHDQANKIRSQRPDLDTEKWFQDGEASLAYQEYLNSFAKRSEDIRNNTKLSVKERNKELDALKQEQQQVEDMFNSLYQLKHAWSDNTEEAQKLGDAIDQDVDTLKQKTLDAAQAIIDAQNEIDQTVIDSYQEQIDNLQKQWEAQDIAEERAKRQTEIANLNNKLAVLQAGNLGNISDELANQLGLEDAKAEYLQKQNDLIEEQQTLQNVQNEKNVRLYQNGQFEWVADPRKVKEEQDKLADMQSDFDSWQKDQLESAQDELKSKVEDYNDWELQQTRQQIIDDLQLKIDAKQKEIEQRNADFIEEQKAWTQQGIDLDGILSSSMDTLNTTYGGKWDAILTTLGEKLKKAKEMYNELLSLGTGATSGASGDSNVSSSNGLSANSQNKVIIDEMQANSQAWHNASASEKKDLEQRNQELGKSIGATYNSSTGTWTYPKYHTGLREGLVGDKTSISSILSRFNIKDKEKMAVLLNGEAIIRNPINMIDNIVGGFRGMANLLSDKFVPNSTPTSVTGDTYNFEHIEVKSNDANQFMKNLKLYANKRN